MENADLTARRRVTRILGHVASSSPSDEAFPPSSLLPLHCSSILNTSIQRRDSRLLFARQGSNSRGRFMHQVSSNQETAPNYNASCRQKLPLDNCLQYGEPLFSRKATGSGTAAAASNSTPPSSRSINDSSDAPLFARKSCRMIENQQVINSCNNRRRQQQPSNGMEWCPRMDVAESRARFVVTVELPGVQPADIHLEVDNENLTIMGKRSVSQWRMAKGSCESPKAKNYHRREISEGPYRIVWPLPRDVNKDAVSAELLDGFLRITLPKL